MTTGALRKEFTGKKDAAICPKTHGLKAQCSQSVYGKTKTLFRDRKTETLTVPSSTKNNVINKNVLSSTTKFQEDEQPTFFSKHLHLNSVQFSHEFFTQQIKSLFK